MFPTRESYDESVFAKAEQKIFSAWNIALKSRRRPSVTRFFWLNPDAPTHNVEFLGSIAVSSSPAVSA
jgi:hypothetical protein